MPLTGLRPGGRLAWVFSLYEKRCRTSVVSENKLAKLSGAPTFQCARLTHSVRHGYSEVPCPVCGELVQRDRVETENQFRCEGLAWDRYHLHPRCFADWESERAKL